jgi:hypothetical protein
MIAYVPAPCVLLCDGWPAATELPPQIASARLTLALLLAHASLSSLTSVEGQARMHKHRVVPSVETL